VPFVHARSTLRTLLVQMAHSTRTVLSVRPLLFAVLFSAGVFTLVRMQTYLYQPYLTAAGFDLAAVGGIMAALSLAGAAGAHRIDDLRRLLGERALVLGLPALFTVTYFALGAAVSTWAVLLLALQGVLAGVYSPLTKELLNREILDSSERATVLSVESMSRRLVFGLFSPLAGRMMDASGGLQAGLYTTAILGLVATFVLGGYLLGRASYARGFEGERAPLPLPEMGSGPDRLD
jgi:predicted MFS family arabinose efflux permease